MSVVQNMLHELYVRICSIYKTVVKDFCWEFSTEHPMSPGRVLNAGEVILVTWYWCYM